MNIRLGYYRATATNHFLHHKSHYVSSVSTVDDLSLDSDILATYISIRNEGGELC